MILQLQRLCRGTPSFDRGVERICGASSELALLSIDFVDLEKSAGGYEYILFIVDSPDLHKGTLRKIDLPKLLPKNYSMTSSRDSDIRKGSITLKTRGLRPIYYTI